MYPNASIKIFWLLFFYSKFWSWGVWAPLPSASSFSRVFWLVVGGGSLVAQSCLTLATPWTVAGQAPLSVGFSRQEYWSGLPFPSPGNHPNPGIEPRSPVLQADSLSTELQEKPWLVGIPGNSMWVLGPACPFLLKHLLRFW